MKTRPSQKNRVILIRNGHQFIQTNIKLIDIAKKFILLHTYIFLDDEVTKPILDALMRASQRGVRVFILIDAFGSFEFSDEMIKKLEENRIQFSYFTPLFKLHKLGRRLHQKSLIIDNRLCLTGGINLSKEFNDKDKPWLDFSCCIEGEEVHHIYQHTIHFYLEHFPENKAELLSFNEYKHIAKDSTLIKTNTNDFLKYNQSIYNSYLKAIYSAKDEIVIMATYFLPGKKFLKALKRATDRGVRVKLVFGKVSDQPLAKFAEKYLYEWYLKNNIQIYEWEDSIIHGKLALVDSKWVTIGSYNHNYISRYGNLELNIEVFSNSFAEVISQEFNTILSKSQEIKLDNLHLTHKSEFLSWLTYIIVNILTIFSLIFTFRNKADDKNKILK